MAKKKYHPDVYKKLHELLKDQRGPTYAKSIIRTTLGVDVPLTTISSIYRRLKCGNIC